MIRETKLYKLTFEDGSEAYLAHYGVLGMKWGVRNAETKARYSRNSSAPRQKLSEYSSEKVSETSLKKYSEQARQLNRVRIGENTDGIIYSKNGKLVGMINTEKKPSGEVWIQGLEVFGDNQGKGLGTALLDKAVNDMGATHLSVRKTNVNAKRLYDKYGFETYKDDGYMQYMRYQKQDRLFVSGSSKTQSKDSEYYRRKLPKEVRKELKGAMKSGSTILVGDAPGIDRQVQDYLNKKKYKNVEVYSPGTQARYKAGKDWINRTVNDTKHEPGSKEWLAKKDVAMTNNSTRGLAVILDEGANATRRNVERLRSQGKDVTTYELSKSGKRKDRWVDSKNVRALE